MPDLLPEYAKPLIPALSELSDHLVELADDLERIRSRLPHPDEDFAREIDRTERHPKIEALGDAVVRLHTYLLRPGLIEAKPDFRTVARSGIFCDADDSTLFARSSQPEMVILPDDRRKHQEVRRLQSLVRDLLSALWNLLVNPHERVGGRPKRYGGWPQTKHVAANFDTLKSVVREFSEVMQRVQSNPSESLSPNDASVGSLAPKASTREPQTSDDACKSDCSSESGAPESTPEWNKVEGKLTYGSHSESVSEKARNLIRVLDAFQKAGWTKGGIPSPFAKVDIHKLLSLIRNEKRQREDRLRQGKIPRLVSFVRHRRDDGEFIVWRSLDE